MNSTFSCVNWVLVIIHACTVYITDVLLKVESCHAVSVDRLFVNLLYRLKIRHCADRHIHIVHQ